MIKNVGTIDQGIRLAVGVGLVLAAFFVQGWWCLIAIPGVIFAVTGLFARCPAYLPFGISTTGT